MEQVRYLKKKIKRNRTNSQQTGVSTKYNCGMAEVGCSEDASTTLPFEAGQIGKGSLFIKSVYSFILHWTLFINSFFS